MTDYSHTSAGGSSDSTTNIRVYGTRGKCIRPQHVQDTSPEVKKFFSHRVALARTDDAIFVAVRYREGAQRAQTGFVRLPADEITSTEDIREQIREFVHDRTPEIEDTGRGDTALFPWGDFENVGVPNEIRTLLENDRRIRIGTSRKSEALTIANKFINKGRPFALVREDRHVREEANYPVEPIDDIIALDSEFKKTIISDETRSRIKDIQEKERKRKKAKIISSIEEQIDNAKQMGLSRSEIENPVEAKLETTYESSTTPSRENSGGSNTPQQTTRRSRSTQSLDSPQSRSGLDIKLFFELAAVVVGVAILIGVIFVVRQFNLFSTDSAVSSVIGTIQANQMLTIATTVSITLIILFLYIASLLRPSV